jgi:hypothetical protein
VSRAPGPRGPLAVGPSRVGEVAGSGPTPGTPRAALTLSTHGPPPLDPGAPSYFMTTLQAAADAHCGGGLVALHEGGYRCGRLRHWASPGAGFPCRRPPQSSFQHPTCACA